jgi:hypothetical protein
LCVAVLCCRHLANTFYTVTFIANHGENKTEYSGENKDFPTMEDFLLLHEGGLAYELFTRKFVRRIVGENVWGNNCYQKLLSEYCTASDEAFGLLTLENNYDRWTSMQGTGDYANASKMAPGALYTNSGNSKGKKGSPTRFQGWTNEGYKRFDTLHKLVKLDRAKPGRKQFEEEMKQYYEHEMCAKLSKKARRAQREENDEDEEIYPPHDFEDVDMGGNNSDVSDGESGSNGNHHMKEADEEEKENDDEDEYGSASTHQNDDDEDSE